MFDTDATINGHDFTIYGILDTDNVLDDDEKDLGIPNIVISDLVFDGTKKNSTDLNAYGFNSQNQGNKAEEPVRAFNLTLTGCTFQNFSDKGLYITNVQNIVIDHCVFKDVAIGKKRQPD